MELQRKRIELLPVIRRRCCGGTTAAMCTDTTRSIGHDTTFGSAHVLRDEDRVQDVTAEWELALGDKTKSHITSRRQLVAQQRDGVVT